MEMKGCETHRHFLHLHSQKRATFNRLVFQVPLDEIPAAADAATHFLLGGGRCVLGYDTFDDAVTCCRLVATPTIGIAFRHLTEVAIRLTLCHILLQVLVGNCPVIDLLALCLREGIVGVGGLG